MLLNGIKITNFKKNQISKWPFTITSESVPTNPEVEGLIGCAIWLVALKGLYDNSIFHQV